MSLPSGEEVRPDISTADAFRRRIAELEARLAEAEETLEAIRSGEVDAVVVGNAAESRVFTLESADRPYRLLIEQMREGAVTLSAEGIILYCNQAFADLVAAPTANVVGARLEQFIVSSREPIDELIALGGRTEIKLRVGSGAAAVAAALSLSELPTEEGRLVCGVVTDLTETRAHARDLADARQDLAVANARREGEESYRALFNSIDAGFCIIEMAFDAEGRASDYKIVEANPAFERQTGLVGAVGKWMSEIVPELERHWHDIYGRVALTGEPVRFENYADTLDQRWFDVYAYRVGESQSRHVAILFNDISDRRRAETAVREINETLEQRVVERTAELAAANDRLQIEMAERQRTEEALRHSQKVEAIGQLTGGVAHDFNNLLTIIRSAVDLLRRRDLTEEKRRRYIDAISDTSDRAAKLTNQLLAYARRQPLRPEVFDAAERVRDSLDMLHTTVGARVQVAIEIACDPCFVEADANQFETALINMAVNARDAMDGEGDLTITIDSSARLTEELGADTAACDFVSVEVADTGQGIPADRLERIFEPFFTTKGIGKGTGLGLSQVYGFAKQSGGEVQVESEVGRGTTFTLYLPRSEAGAMQAQAAPEPDVPHGQARGRILVVEDNSQVGDFAAQLLAELGYSTAWVSDAAAAIATFDADAQGFDLVFSDVVMPGHMSGVELARELRRRRPDLPVVLTTGYSEALADGDGENFELLRKPYSVEALSRLMRKLLRNSDTTT